MLPRIILSIIVILCLSLGLAWISNGFESLQGWVSFLAASFLGSGILLAGWWAIKSDPAFRSEQTDPSKPSLPTWLGWLVVMATLLRLGAGVIWFVALPNLGYGGEVERSGYVMSDAHRRDTAAWRLAQSEKSLTAAFTEYRGADQYGGLLFVSAWFYRYLGGDLHQPLQFVVLTASFSALAVLFTWAAAQRIWGEKVAVLAAWIVTLFPDAVLLGSSQMREAFMMTLVMMAFYGLIRYCQDRSRSGIAWMIFSVFISVPLSPLFALMLTGTLLLMAVFFGQNHWLKNWRFWAVFLGLIGLGMIAVFLFGGNCQCRNCFTNAGPHIGHYVKYCGHNYKKN